MQKQLAVLSLLQVEKRFMSLHHRALSMHHHHLNPSPLAVEYLIVGGGGGGSGYAYSADGQGGGGAGGLRTNHPDCPAPLRSAAYSVTAGSEYTVTIGAGGYGGRNGPSGGTGNIGNPGGYQIPNFIQHHKVS